MTYKVDFSKTKIVLFKDCRQTINNKEILNLFFYTDLKSYSGRFIYNSLFSDIHLSLYIPNSWFFYLNKKNNDTKSYSHYYHKVYYPINRKLIRYYDMEKDCKLIDLDRKLLLRVSNSILHEPFKELVNMAIDNYFLT